MNFNQWRRAYRFNWKESAAHKFLEACCALNIQQLIQDLIIILKCYSVPLENEH